MSIFTKYQKTPVQVRASFWFLICAFLQKGISMITTPIFTRLLNTVEYGQFNVFNSWLGIVTVLVSLNLSAGVCSQGLVKFGDRKFVFASALQGLTFTLCAAWTVVYLVFSRYINRLLDLNTVQMLAMLLMIWLTAVFGIWSNTQRVDYKYRLLVLITILVSIAKPGLSIILIRISDDKVTARILGLMLVELIGYSSLFVFQIKKGRTFFSGEFWRYAIKFNIPLIPHYLSQIVLNSSDRIMISKLVGDSEAGIYSLAYSLSLIMTLFNTALMQTLSPWIYKKIKNKRISEIKNVAYSALIMIAVLNLLLIILAPEVVKIFAPASYYDAIWVIPPVAMSVFFMFGYDLFARFEFYYEKTRLVMAASTTGAILNIILNYIFISLYGYIAAGYTSLVCFVVYAVAHYVMMNKVCDECAEGERPYSLKVLFFITIPFVVLGFAFLLTYKMPFIRYGIIVVIAFVVAIKRNTIVDYMKHLNQIKEVKNEKV